MSIKLEIEKKQLQLKSQKYKGSNETTTSNYMPIKETAQNKWKHFLKATSFKG